MAELKLVPKTPFVVDKKLDRLVFPFKVRDPKGLKFWEIQPAVDEFKARISSDKGIPLSDIKLTVLSPELADLLVREYPHSVIPFSPLVVNAAVAYGKAEDKVARSIMRFRTKDDLSVNVTVSAQGMLAMEAFSLLKGNSDGSLLEGRNAYLINRFFEGYRFSINQVLRTAELTPFNDKKDYLLWYSPAELIFIPPKSGWYKPNKGENSHLLVPCDATDPQAIGYARAEGPLFAPIVRKVAGLGDDSKILFIDSGPDTAFHSVLLEMPKPVHQVELDLAKKMGL